MKAVIDLRCPAACLALAVSVVAQAQPLSQQLHVQPPAPRAGSAAAPARSAPGSSGARAVTLQVREADGGERRSPASRAEPLAVPPPAVAAQGTGLAEYERQLDAIRKALLHTTLEKSPTRIFSHAWIDGDGRLHEDSQFRSDATVQGVRVLSYVQRDGESAEPAATIAVDMLPSALTKRSVDSGTCSGYTGRWRNLLQFEVKALPVLTAEQVHAAQWIQRQARLAWLPHAEQSRRWQVQAQAPGPSGLYERFVYGPPPAEGWSAVLHIAPAVPPPPDLRSLIGWDPRQRGLHFELTLTVAESPHSAPFWQASSPLHIPLAWLAEDSASWRSRLGQALHTRMAEWMRALDAQGACLPVHFNVAATDTSWTVGAGAVNGLKTGDRLLILDRRQLPQRVLHPEAVSSLALMEVQHLDKHRARLRHLAGPPLASQGDWVAFPF